MRAVPERPARGKRIGIFGKGGSGKSTVTKVERVLATIPSIAASWLSGARFDSMTAESALLDVVRRVETAEARRSQEPMGVVRAG